MRGRKQVALTNSAVPYWQETTLHHKWFPINDCFCLERCNIHKCPSSSPKEITGIDCFIVHHVTMTHNLANIKYDMINNLLQFSNNLDKITDQAVKKF